MTTLKPVPATNRDLNAAPITNPAPAGETPPAEGAPAQLPDQMDKSPAGNFNAYGAPGSFSQSGSEADSVHGPAGFSQSGTDSRSTTRFETATWNLKPPPAGLTTKDIDANLATAYPKGSDFKGVTAGSEEERRVKYATFQISGSMKPNTTTNILVPDVDGKGNAGRVKVSTDKDGKVTSELLGKGEPVSPTKFKDIDEAKKKLQTDFGIKDFSEVGGAKWTKEELEKVYDGFSKLGTEERKALNGVTLERAANNGTTADPNRVGYFDWKGGYDAKTGKAYRSETLSLDDRVFAADKKTFSGTNEPASYQLILHEAGHAVESKNRREALWNASEATEKYNTAIDNKAPAAELATLRADYQAKTKALNAAQSGASSKTLADFNAYVKKNKIENPTDYAATNPADFFAESFMLYKTNPTALQAANPKLYDYFAQNKHL